MATPASVPVASPQVESAQTAPVAQTKAPVKSRLVECGQILPQSRVPKSTSQGGAGSHLEWACTPAGQWVRVLSSTAKHPNRERDKKRIEETVGLDEFGDSATEFYAAKSGLGLVAIGYERIVYGDHGPYVEFSQEQICWANFPNFVEKPTGCYFDEFWTVDGLTMLYSQKRAVKNKPNPPRGPTSVSNNCPDGYANYRVGKLYISAEADTIAVNRPVGASRRRRRGGGGGGRGRGAAEAATAADGEAECDATDAYWPGMETWGTMPWYGSPWPEHGWGEANSSGYPAAAHWPNAWGGSGAAEVWNADTTAKDKDVLQVGSDSCWPAYVPKAGCVGDSEAVKPEQAADAAEIVASSDG
eukprot:gnl/TRDRNA2_/TRDRNA2_29190_c0_seq1.p1 gnl/TRDRNA2_/TRDRNA2_29190_c0~~gnl/TRDRNA2_/TRDRNA2_29190_c0_seq1.p1  ORF type:complete len:358 (+),score=52.62 gnl/TRDRNA2_/TRDRNA2_29190_c0_seq1:107-1180(+)